MKKKPIFFVIMLVLFVAFMINGADASDNDPLIDDNE